MLNDLAEAMKALDGKKCRRDLCSWPAVWSQYSIALGPTSFCDILRMSVIDVDLDAPNIRQSHYTGLLESVGISRRKSNASVFYRDRDGIRIGVHGDDFLVLGDDQGLQEVDDLLRSTYELKRLGTLGFDKGDEYTS